MDDQSGKKTCAGAVLGNAGLRFPFNRRGAGSMLFKISVNVGLCLCGLSGQRLSVWRCIELEFDAGPVGYGLLHLLLYSGARGGVIRLPAGPVLQRICFHAPQRSAPFCPVDRGGVLPVCRRGDCTFKPNPLPVRYP